MTKLIITSLTIIGLFFENSYSQKIDLDKELWVHSYIRLPKSKDLSTLKTYSITMFANMDNLNRIGLSSDKIEAALKLDGYIYTQGLADILIEVTIENLREISQEVKTKESSTYEGGKTVITKTYIPSTLYAIPTSIKVIKALSKEMITNNFIGGDQNPIVIGSEEFSTYEAANATFKVRGDRKLELFKEKYFSIINGLLNSFKEKYDFTITEEPEVFWHVDLKKSPEFAEFNTKLKEGKEIFANQKAFDDIKAGREKLAPILQYLRENADKITGDDKRNKKLKYAYLLNLGRIQLWLEMLDECAITAQQVIDNDYDKLDGKNLLRSVNFLKEELKNSSNGSRHFSRDGFTSTPCFKAFEIKPIPFKIPNPPDGFKFYPGTMTSLTGEKHVGGLWAKATGALSFDPSDETRFVFEKNNELKEQSIDPDEIDEIVLESGEKFKRLKYKADGNNLFFQILHEGTNFKIIKYFSSKISGSGFGIANLNNGSEMCIMNNSTGEIKSVGSKIGINATKKTVEFYANCEPLKVKILANEFGKMNDLDGQIKALAFFEQNCK